MAWYDNIVAVRSAHARALRAEEEGMWHVTVQQYLFCLEQSKLAADDQAVRYFAAQLGRAYNRMGFSSKARYYTQLVR